jgi:hypothetical protein
MEKNNLGIEMEKLAQYYDCELKIDQFVMTPIFEAVHKKTGKKYVYRLSMTDVKDFGPGVVNMINELKMEIREDKLSDLGI